MDLYNNLQENGYAIIDSIAHQSLIDEIAIELKQAFKTEQTIKVDNDGINIATLNGDHLLSKSNATATLYALILDKLKAEYATICELEDNKIGLSANLLYKRDNQFRLHFDRNQLTVLTYITQSPNFPLVLYPFMREDPRTYTQGKFPPVKDKSKVTPIKVYPKPGLSVFFWGRVSLHGVLFEATTETSDIEHRYSLQFAFDLEKTNYEGENYYGKAND